MGGAVEFKTVTIKKPMDVNFILGQSHFIKTVEDIYEVVSGSVPGAKFCLAFCESSGDCLVRIEGNDEELKALARDTALAIGAGHSFILFFVRLLPDQCPECDKKHPGSLHYLLRNGKPCRSGNRRIGTGSGDPGRD